MRGLIFSVKARLQNTLRFIFQRAELVLNKRHSEISNYSGCRLRHSDCPVSPCDDLTPEEKPSRSFSSRSNLRQDNQYGSAPVSTPHTSRFRMKCPHADAGIMRIYGGSHSAVQQCFLCSKAGINEKPTRRQWRGNCREDKD